MTMAMMIECMYEYCMYEIKHIFSWVDSKDKEFYSFNFDPTQLFLIEGSLDKIWWFHFILLKNSIVLIILESRFET